MTDKSRQSLKKTEVRLDRRQLLKALTATSSTLLTTAFVSPEWVKPVVEVGQLPAHAQISGGGLPPLNCIDPGTEIDVLLIIDRSGSISLADINDVKLALKLFVAGRNFSKEQVGVVSFNETATLDQPLSTDPKAISIAIDNLTSGGGTNLTIAIDTALQELNQSGKPKEKRVMILTSDGASSDDPIPSANAAKASVGRILTVAIGANSDTTTLRSIATQNDFYFTPEVKDLVTIFDPNCNL